MSHALPDVVVAFHENVQALAGRFLAEQRRHYYVTPTRCAGVRFRSSSSGFRTQGWGSRVQGWGLAVRVACRGSFHQGRLTGTGLVCDLVCDLVRIW